MFLHPLTAVVSLSFGGRSIASSRLRLCWVDPTQGRLSSEAKQTPRTCPRLLRLVWQESPLLLASSCCAWICFFNFLAFVIQEKDICLHIDFSRQYQGWLHSTCCCLFEVLKNVSSRSLSTLCWSSFPWDLSMSLVACSHVIFALLNFCANCFLNASLVPLQFRVQLFQFLILFRFSFFLPARLNFVNELVVSSSHVFEVLCISSHFCSRFDWQPLPAV